MRKLLRLILLCLALLSLSLTLAQRTLTDANGDAVVIDDIGRVIALGGSVTEIIYTLGASDNLVAVDTSSVYPSELVDTLPKVGYVRSLGAEGVLSLDPTLIITTPDAGPPEVVQQLRDTGVAIFIVPDEDSVAGAKAKIRTIADIFERHARAEDLIRQIELDMLEAQLIIDSVAAAAKPSVMFVYARGAGALSVSGTGTSAHAMIELARGVNAVTEYEGYRPLTAEAAVTAAPEVLLFLSRGLESVGGVAGLAELPGLALTPAYEDARVIAMDDLYLLGFGPRVGQAVLELTRALYAQN
jgi:iron complex transport system substrate-binding protein